MRPLLEELYQSPCSSHACYNVDPLFYIAQDAAIALFSIPDTSKHIIKEKVEILVRLLFNIVV